MKFLFGPFLLLAASTILIRTDSSHSMAGRMAGAGGRGEEQAPSGAWQKALRCDAKCGAGGRKGRRGGAACCDTAQRGTPACSCPLLNSLKEFVLQQTGSSEREAHLVGLWLLSLPGARLVPPGEPPGSSGWVGRSTLPAACVCRGAAWLQLGPLPPTRPPAGCRTIWKAVRAMGDELVQAVLLRHFSSRSSEAAVRKLLAAGARVDRFDVHGTLPVHLASWLCHEGVVKLLMEAAPATAMAVDSVGLTPLHHAAGCGDEVVRLLLSRGPAAATMLTACKQAPIHRAALFNNAAAVQLLLEAAPELASALDAYGSTPLHLVLRSGINTSPQQVMETARRLLGAAPAVQPALEILLQYSQRSACLFADLVARLPLSQEQWHSIPAPCPDLARSLPAVLERSTAEAGWLVGRRAGTASFLAKEWVADMKA